MRVRKLSADQLYNAVYAIRVTVQERRKDWMLGKPYVLPDWAIMDAAIEAAVEPEIAWHLIETGRLP